MKELLIHIGYPKTATTTLQEDIFVKLHDLRKINYLGRTTKSSHTRFGGSDFNGVDWVRQIRKKMILRDQMKDGYEVLKKDVLNVMSDEDLTFHGFFHSAQFGMKIDHALFPQHLSEIIGPDVHVSLLVTTRNQSDLIFSSYVQKYRYVKRTYKKYSFDDFLNNSNGFLGKDIEDHLSLYNFDYTIKLWEETFHAKAEILLFEDFVKDKKSYLNKLLDVLGLKESVSTILKIDHHFRKRKETENYVSSGFWELSSFGNLLALVFGEKKLFAFLERRYHMRSSIYLNQEKKMFLTFKPVNLPKLTKTQRAKIKNIFKESNELLAERYQIKREKLIEYGYI